MNWDDLKVLLALSREGSTRKAASTMGVSNTTVMRRLESLEEHIGGKLLIARLMAISRLRWPINYCPPPKPLNKPWSRQSGRFLEKIQSSVGV